MKANKIVKKHRTKKELDELVQSLAWNARFDCYTRPGLEQVIWPQIAGTIQFVVFVDVDDMHSLNEKHGYDGVNEIIKKSLAVRFSDYVAGQWFSGDEFAIFVGDNPDRVGSDPVELCHRLIDSFRSNGASITLGVSPVASQDLTDVVKPAFEMVQNAKRAGQRGSINIAEGV